MGDLVVQHMGEERECAAARRTSTGSCSGFNKTPGEPPESLYSRRSFHPKIAGQQDYAN
jgi:hypothetical protein